MLRVAQLLHQALTRVSDAPAPGAPEGRELVERYLLEIDYTPYGAACKDPYITDRQELVLCRRQTKHTGEHATRRGAGQIVWGEPTKETQDGPS